MNKDMGMSHEEHEHAFENEHRHRPIETLMVVCSSPTVRMQITQLARLKASLSIYHRTRRVFHHCHSFPHKSRDVGPFCLLSRRTLTGRCSNSTLPFFPNFTFCWKRKKWTRVLAMLWFALKWKYVVSLKFWSKRLQALVVNIQRAPRLLVVDIFHIWTVLSFEYYC